MLFRQQQQIAVAVAADKSPRRPHTHALIFSSICASTDERAASVPAFISSS